jgi:hypothetical protein
MSLAAFPGFYLIWKSGGTRIERSASSPASLGNREGVLPLAWRNSPSRPKRQVKERRVTKRALRE